MESILGYVFTDLERVKQALTHSSFVYEYNLGTKASNQCLEFLGDAVLGLLVSDLLYNYYPSLSEGELSKARAKLICEPSLAMHAPRLDLGKHLLLSHAESAGGGAEKDSILSDAMEAIIGAIYLDGGLESARTFVNSLFEEDAKKTLTHSAGRASITDPKSRLQEKFQKASRVALVYEIIGETGPAHKKEFTATVSHKGWILGTGTGKSKKEAECIAATEALKGSL